ncbi:hypothetical protein GF312_17080 [Candidatus Poribacteria bacterium]|nr:hypothetical protein [Candidatus Poribacteria bacterium]
MIKYILVFILCILVLSGCAAKSNPMEDTPMDDAEKPAGFWLGLWHGMIVLLTLIISIFKSSVGIYEVHNSGLWYNIGFVLGALIIYGGSSGTACRTGKSS